MSESFFDDEDIRISKIFLEKIKKDQDKGERLSKPEFVEDLLELLTKKKNDLVKYEVEELELHNKKLP